MGGFCEGRGKSCEHIHIADIPGFFANGSYGFEDAAADFFLIQLNGSETGLEAPGLRADVVNQVRRGLPRCMLERLAKFAYGPDQSFGVKRHVVSDGRLEDGVAVCRLVLALKGNQVVMRMDWL